MKYVLGGIGVLIGVVLLLGILAPTDLHIERQIEIQKPREEVFAEIKMLRNHSKWSPWEKKDPNIIKSYSGTDGEVGFVASWEGNSEVGVGEQEIKAIQEGSRIDYELRFKKPMEDTSTAYLITEDAAGGGTLVTWGMRGKSPFPFNIVCLVLNMRKQLAAQFDEGLLGLKASLE
ncbi:MAG: SRPBCC family protein [Bdellovibrionales bacterium]